MIYVPRAWQKAKKPNLIYHKSSQDGVSIAQWVFKILRFK